MTLKGIRHLQPLRWLHLSDFHFKAKETWDRRATLTALLKHAKQLRDNDFAPDLVFVTGDIAHSGKHEEYEHAERFFTELANVLELEPRNAFFFVPGNHDVDRGAIGPADAPTIASLNDQAAIEALFEHRSTMELLGRRLENFYAFTERFTGTARGWHSHRPWRVDVLEVNGIRIGVLQLNSAWASGTNNENDLLVGEAQLRWALHEAEDAFVRIVLVHHPIADLRDLDRAPLEGLLTSGDVHFLLRGHLHRTRTTLQTTPDGGVLELAAGASYVSNWDKLHMLTELNLSTGNADVHLYRYSDQGKGFWAKDTLSYENVPDGIWTVPVPALRLDNEKQALTTDISDERRATLTARYRMAAAAVHGSVRFIGFADHRPRPNVLVPELFVPLRFEQRHRHDDEKDFSTEDLLRHLLSVPAPAGTAGILPASAPGTLRVPAGGTPALPAGGTPALPAGGTPALPAPHAVILGDPGSGKTTLCRYLTVVLAGESPVNDIDVPDNILPLFLPFREYVRECREQKDLSLVDFLVNNSGVQLQLPIAQDYLEKALDNGNAVLILDGLDEVGSADERVTMRERVQAFYKLYPNVSLLLTSRIAGYDEAPMPNDFIHLVLAPFNDDDLRQFVTHWYNAQEPSDPLARDRGIADLNAALNADRHVRELARNPMLATLIALVHRYEAHLPGERAALYDICVKTLLETWPESRRTSFKEIDARLQRTYLETLAYRMQCSRSSDDRNVTIERGDLVQRLTEIVREREGDSSPLEETQSLVERWVDFLQKGSGLLVEKQAGVFEFFHLSLMEYLAARGMDAAEVVEATIAEKFGDQAWREVCLLAVGSKATEKPFLDRLFAKLKEKDGGWSFLLRCLREEAAFDEEQRSAIIIETGKTLLRQLPWFWTEQQQTIAEILQFSLRHAAWTKTWLESKLGSSTGDDLRGLVALRHGNKDLPSVLDRRPDTRETALDLLEYWPGSHIGDWAAAHVETVAAFHWARKSPGELQVIRSLSRASAPAAGLLTALLTTNGNVNWMAANARKELADHERPGGRGLPTGVLLKSSEVSLSSTTAVSCVLGQQYDFASDFASDFARYLASDLASDLARYFASDFARDFLATDLSVSMPTPKASSPTVDVNAWEQLRTATDDDQIKTLLSQAFGRITAEAWISLATTAESPHPERVAYFQRRVQNAWLLYVWPEVDRRFEKANHPDLDALYYTLGFTQATTTWQWPPTERWRTLLGGDPPEHWLPRSQWHLCWHTYALNNPEENELAVVHRQGIDDALDEGMNDPERRHVAEALRELLPQES